MNNKIEKFIDENGKGYSMMILMLLTLKLSQATANNKDEIFDSCIKEIGDILKMAIENFEKENNNFNSQQNNYKFN